MLKENKQETCRCTGNILKILGVFLCIPESKLARCFGMVLEMLRISSHGTLRRCDEDPIPSICKCQNWYDSISIAH